MKQFDEFRQIIKYKKRVKGSPIAPLGLDPNIDVSDTEKVEALKKLLQFVEDKEIEMRIDPLLGKYSLHTTLISEERAKRPMSIKQAERPKQDKKCQFCRPDVYLETAVPKIHHGKKKIITILNLFPYNSPHYVTIFTNEHKARLEDLTEEDMENYLVTGKELAERIKKEGCIGMWDFINWGAEAGGSQPHAHAQRGGLYAIMRTLSDREVKAVRDREKESKKDPFECCNELVRGSPLLISEDENVIVYAPYAPMFTDQVDIVTKRASNYLNLDERTTASVSRAMVRILRGLNKERGINDLNILTHQTRFINFRGYRMHWHICPRKSKIAGMELGGIYIVSAYPRDTAGAVREAFKK